MMLIEKVIISFKITTITFSLKYFKYYIFIDTLLRLRFVISTSNNFKVASNVKRFFRNRFLSRHFIDKGSYFDSTNLVPLIIFLKCLNFTAQQFFFFEAPLTLKTGKRF